MGGKYEFRLMREKWQDRWNKTAFTTDGRRKKKSRPLLMEMDEVNRIMESVLKKYANWIE